MARLEGAPKHVVLREWIRGRIESGEFAGGERLPSENEFSERFNVSRQTVRQAIGSLEADGLLVRRRGSGTYVEASLSACRNRTMTIGVVTTYLDDYIFPSIIKGVEGVLTAAGYTMNLSITHNRVEQEHHVLEAILEKGVDGLIIEPTKSAFPNANIGLYRRLEQNGVPIIFINGYYPGMNAGHVVLDDFAAGKLATDYLIKRGHTEIGGIFKSDDIQGHLRYGGYAQAMSNAGMQVNDREVMWYVTEDNDELWSGERDRYILRRIDRCSAVVCYNDQIAARVTELFGRCGKYVPRDVSLIGFDNSNLAVMSGLTTVNHPKAQLGEAAAKRILKLIEMPDFQPNLLMQPELIERESVLPVKREND